MAVCGKWWNLSVSSHPPIFTTDSFAGVLVVGPGLQRFGPFAMAGIGVPVAAAILIPACLGWLGEKPSKTMGRGWACYHPTHIFFMSYGPDPFILNAFPATF